MPPELDELVELDELPELLEPLEVDELLLALVELLDADELLLDVLEDEALVVPVLILVDDVLPVEDEALLAVIDETAVELVLEWLVPLLPLAAEAAAMPIAPELDDGVVVATVEVDVRAPLPEEQAARRTIRMSSPLRIAVLIGLRLGKSSLAGSTGRCRTRSAHRNPPDRATGETRPQRPPSRPDIGAALTRWENVMGTSLKGKVAVITGSTSGIGLGVARALGAEGAALMLNGFGPAQEIADLQQALRTELSIAVAYHGADMSKPTEIEALIAATVSELGRIDILVNNAGIQHVAPVEEFPIERWDQILAINLSSNFHAIRAALPHLRRQGWGRIVNIASAHGLVASKNKAAYVAAKHGVLGLTKVVALETATTAITCNAICPGWVLTPLVQKQVDDLAVREHLSPAQAKERLLAEKTPSLQFATPEQIGGIAAFLCSPAAAEIRGAEISVDGGWTAQ